MYLSNGIKREMGVLEKIILLNKTFQGKGTLFSFISSGQIGV
jgi:hypothetical protein